MNINNCNPKKEILNQEDYVLELWYGKPGLFFISKLREINRIEENEYGDINYYIDKNNWLLKYNKDINTNHSFYFSEKNIYKILLDEYKLTYVEIVILIKRILEEIIPNCNNLTFAFPLEIINE